MAKWTHSPIFLNVLFVFLILLILILIAVSKTSTKNEGESQIQSTNQEYTSSTGTKSGDITTIIEITSTGTKRSDTNIDAITSIGTTTIAITNRVTTNSMTAITQATSTIATNTETTTIQSTTTQTSRTMTPTTQTTNTQATTTQLTITMTPTTQATSTQISTTLVISTGSTIKQTTITTQVTSPTATLSKVQLIKMTGGGPWLDSFLVKILEMLRVVMPQGVPSAGVPVMDPYAVNKLDVPQITQGVVSLFVKIGNMKLKNLSTFQTKNAHIDLNQLLIQLELLIPTLIGDAQYTMSGAAALFFPISGNGLMTMQFSNFDIKMKIWINMDENTVLTVSSLESDITFDAIQIHFENILGGGLFGDVINLALSLIGSTIWNLMKPLFQNDIDKFMLSMMQNLLPKCGLFDVLSGKCGFLT